MKKVLATLVLGVGLFMADTAAFAGCGSSCGPSLGCGRPARVRHVRRCGGGGCHVRHHHRILGRRCHSGSCCS